MQLSPGSPAYPRLQVQFASTDEPGALAEFGVQLWQSTTEEPSELGLYVFAGHEVHAGSPARSLYVPGAHAWQA